MNSIIAIDPKATEPKPAVQPPIDYAAVVTLHRSQATDFITPRGGPIRIK